MDLLWIFYGSSMDLQESLFFIIIIMFSFLKMLATFRGGEILVWNENASRKMVLQQRPKIVTGFVMFPSPPSLPPPPPPLPLFLFSLLFRFKVETAGAATLIFFFHLLASLLSGLIENSHTHTHTHRYTHGDRKKPSPQMSYRSARSRQWKFQRVWRKSSRSVEDPLPGIRLPTQLIPSADDHLEKPQKHEDARWISKTLTVGRNRFEVSKESSNTREERFQCANPHDGLKPVITSIRNSSKTTQLINLREQGERGNAWKNPPSFQSTPKCNRITNDEALAAGWH